MRVVTVAYWAICADLPVLRGGGDAVAAALVSAAFGDPDDDDLAQAIIIAEAAEQGPLDPEDLGRRLWEWAETNGLGMGGLTGHVLELYGGDVPQFLAARGRRGRSREPAGMPIAEASRIAWDGS